MMALLDIRSLIACQILLAVAFAVVLYAMRRAHPEVKGLGSATWCYALAAAGMVLLFLRGRIPDIVSITVSNTLTEMCMFMMYRAVAKMVGSRAQVWLPVVVVAATSGTIFYYSEVEHDIVPRIVAAAAMGIFFRLLIAEKLLGKLTGSGSGMVERIFGGALLLTVVGGCYRLVATAVQGTPDDLMQTNSIQTVNFLSTLVCLTVSGVGFLGMATNRLIRLSEEASQLDHLLDVFNRRGIEMQLAREMGIGPLSISMMDLDHFKAINDAEGHAVGDIVLQKVARAIRQSLRAGDWVGRYGGDEFLVVWPATTCEEALRLSERIDTAVAQISLKSTGKRLTLSMGFTETTGGDDVDGAVTNADRALYEAKRDGRNCKRVVLTHKEVKSETTVGDGVMNWS